MNKRTGLAVMRIQPLHKGHCHIIDQMIQNCENVILGIGSTNVSDQWNPFSFELRKKMVHNVFGDRLKIVQLADIGTQEDTNAWVDYVLDKIKKLGLSEPTDYFTGSSADARWYAQRFYLNGISVHNKTAHENESFYQEKKLKILHIVDREKNEVPAATDLRTFIELGAEDWKQWVPAVNHDLVLDNYPEEYKIKR